MLWVHVLIILEQRVWATEPMGEESTITRKLAWIAQPVWGRELSMRWLLNRRRLPRQQCFKIFSHAVNLLPRHTSMSRGYYERNSS